MITVRVELHSARTGKKTTIGRLYISNDGTGTERRGNYDARLLRRGTVHLHKAARVENYPRKAYPVWKLVRRALEALDV